MEKTPFMSSLNICPEGWNNQGGYQGAANPDKSFSHGKKGSTVYKVSVAHLQLQGKFFGCSHRTVSETPSQVISVKTRG